MVLRRAMRLMDALKRWTRGRRASWQALHAATQLWLRSRVRRRLARTVPAAARNVRECRRWLASFPARELRRQGDRKAARKRFEISKLKFKFPRARTYELIKAKFRLYRSQLLQVNTSRKALAEIYTMHSFAPFWNRSLISILFIKNRQKKSGLNN